MTPILLTIAAAVTATAAAYAGRRLCKTLDRRRNRREIERLWAARFEIVRLTVEGGFATQADLWERFVASHPELAPRRTWGA